MRPSAYNLSTKQLFLTYPQCPLKKEYVLELLKVKLAEHKIKDYLIAEEKHANGDDHIHAYISLENVLRTRNPNLLDLESYHGNYQGCRSDKNVIKYCTKDENYIASFDVNTKLKCRESKRKLIFAKLVKEEISLQEAVIEEPSLLNGYRRLKGDLELFLLDSKRCYQHETTRGIWIYGDPGVGKSTMARTQFNGGKVYIKPQSKWWDGYNGEEVVVLEDLDSNCLNHYLKIWADKWETSGETKGGTVPLRYKTFIVTSNYPISHFTGGDDQLQLALERRFKVRHLVSLRSGSRNPLPPAEES